MESARQALYQLNYIHCQSHPKISVLQQWTGAAPLGLEPKLGRARGWGERPGTFAPNSGESVMAQVGALDRHFSTGAQRGASFLTTWTNPVLECEQSQGPDGLRRGGVEVPSVLTNCRGLKRLGPCPLWRKRRLINTLEKTQTSAQGPPQL